MRMMAYRAVVGISFGLGLAACSSFNMSPKCEETTDALARLLATEAAEAPDWARLRSIMSFSQVVEVSSDYNVRECRAVVSGAGVSATIHYRVRQTEGVKDWFHIEIINKMDPLVGELALGLRDEYAN